MKLSWTLLFKDNKLTLFDLKNLNFTVDSAESWDNYSSYKTQVKAASMKNSRKYLDSEGDNLTKFPHETNKQHYHPQPSLNSNKREGIKSR